MVQKKLEQLAGQLIGIPYRHNGRDRSGFDCLGLVWYVYTQMGIPFPSGDGLPINDEWYKSDPDRYIRGLLGVGTTAAESPKPLDLVYFRIINNAVTHSGVLITDNRFLHVLEGRTVQLTKLRGFWRVKYAGARRLI